MEEDEGIILDVTLKATEFRNRFSFLQFDEEKHRYSSIENSVETVYQSVTTILKNFKQDIFNDGFLTEYALKHRKPKDVVRRTWDIKRDFAGLRGTELHLYIESFLQYDNPFVPFTGIEKEIIQFHRFWNEYSKRLQPIDAELRICNKEYGISGTIDFLAQSKISKKYHILDWKSNKDFDLKSKNKLLAPLEDLDDCHLVNYSLQLGLYRWILEKEFNIKMGDSFVIWLNMKNDSFKLFKCLDMTASIEKILESSQRVLTP